MGATYKKLDILKEYFYTTYLMLWKVRISWATTGPLEFPKGDEC